MISLFSLTGRAGRDDLPSEAQLLFSMQDVVTAKDRELFEELRTLRKEIADSEDISAYQLFGDAALVEKTTG